MGKIALFSDIHGNYQALIAIIKDIDKENISDKYCLGDVLSIGPSSKECINLIINNKIPMVLCNHEISYLYDDYEMINEEEREHYYWMASILNKDIMNELRKMPLSISINLGNDQVYLTHYAYDKTKGQHYPPKYYHEKELIEHYKGINADYIFVGHEHSGQRLKTSKFKYINLESSGCRKDDKTFYYIVSLKDDQINIIKKEVPFDRMAFVDTINLVDYPMKDFLKKAFFGIE